MADHPPLVDDIHVSQEIGDEQEPLLDDEGDDEEPISALPDGAAISLEATSTLNLVDVTHFRFGKKATLGVTGSNVDWSPALEADKRAKKFHEQGIRRSVAAILLVQSHRFPHLLLLQENSPSKRFLLPGGRLRPGEGDEDGLRRKLCSKLGVEETVSDASSNWDVSDRVATWWAPDFGDRMYPYCPAHVSTPKERLCVFLVPLIEPRTFSVSPAYELLAVPLFEIYGNPTRYGPLISSVPTVISRYRVNYVS
mmetsp:Transcript_18174/g.37877  ORF Transcript_18174/g.37877 Transcript_18174/m.37877 type:complete len:253 (+) Transcript_18174:2568-3326(+)